MTCSKDCIILKSVRRDVLVSVGNITVILRVLSLNARNVYKSNAVPWSDMSMNFGDKGSYSK